MADDPDERLRCTTWTPPERTGPRRKPPELTDDEDARITADAIAHGPPPATDEELARMRPIHEVLGPDANRPERRMRGPQKAPTKVQGR